MGLAGEVDDIASVRSLDTVSGVVPEPRPYLLCRVSERIAEVIESESTFVIRSRSNWVEREGNFAKKVVVVSASHGPTTHISC